MRRKSAHSNDGDQSLDDNARIEKEISEIDRHYDFDVPSAIDWDLLIVSNYDIYKCYLERTKLIEGR